MLLYVLYYENSGKSTVYTNFTMILENKYNFINDYLLLNYYFINYILLYIL